MDEFVEEKVNQVDGAPGYIIRETVKKAQKEWRRIIFNAVAAVAKSGETESTSFPWWFVATIPYDTTAYSVAQAIKGPFFSREDALAYAEDKYLSDKEYMVYCSSGYISRDWRALYEASKCVLKQIEAEKGDIISGEPT
ncbi:MAG: hypothetical protein SVK08_00055 [Halobacteriota archaeon]|nr:hypothetical protein [Halobacteriota archaeon]